eukprot:TRINITY_DN3919_c0_g1_i10.p1 TRINITY_DN3919_c0_g1~~TRINITY_DN3919_c0_g1_i10.p1  ORF type:complete len:234 (+),score=48.16 TRINITY_DN3919_c0_g1_i10:284-985(+)
MYQQATLMPAPIATPRESEGALPAVLLSMASSYNAEVHFRLAMMHARAVHRNEELLTRGIPTSPSAGIFHLETAATLGHTRAALMCAQLFAGMRPSKAALRALVAALQNFQPCKRRAAAYVQMAAQQGVVGAMTSFAMRCAQGDGVPQSVSEARCWYQEALECLERGGRKTLEAAEFDAEMLAHSLNDAETIQQALTNLSCEGAEHEGLEGSCLLYTSPSPRDRTRSRMPSSA